MSAPCRILYVDNNKDSCELAIVMLGFSGVECAITSVESAAQAMRLIVDENFNLYIFDYRLPEISGVDLCRHIREFDRDTPILFFSAVSMPVNIDEAKAAGANEYLVKPNDLDRLSTTVKRFLDKSH